MFKNKLNLKEIWLTCYKKKGEYNGLTKDIINMRAVISTLAPNLGKEGNKTIQYLKRQMVL